MGETTSDFLVERAGQEQVSWRRAMGWNRLRVCATLLAMLAISATFTHADDQEKGRGRSTKVSTLGPASVDDLLGKDVLNRQGTRLGHVGGVLMEGDRIAYLILYLPAPGGAWRHVPLPASLAEWGMTQPVVVEIEKRRLTDAPAYDADERPDFSDLEWERQIHSYYGENPPDRARESYIVISR